MSWPGGSSIALTAACTALSLGAGCKAHAGDPAPPASIASPAASTSVAAATPLARPWFTGAFRGNYEAKLAPVEVKVGAVKEWAADDGKAASGPGKIELEIDEHGVVDGTGDGALGASRASGKVEGDTLRVLLAPSDITGLHGVLVATRAGDSFHGSIAASSGDSLRVRQAAIELKKQAN